jgi:4-hydroxy-tetrahydrodipicolinate synthase
LSARGKRKQGDLAALRDIQDQIGTYMSIYAIGEDFVTTIKTVVSRKFGYCSGVSRNAGGELTRVSVEQSMRCLSSRVNN